MRTEYCYPVIIELDEDGANCVSFPDLPEALTGGDTLTEALELAEDCLAEALATRIVERDGVPEPSEDIPKPTKTGPATFLVCCPPQISMKVAIYEAMREQNVTKVKLAERLGVNEKEARRICDPHYNTKLPTLERALRILGKRVQVVFEDMAGAA